MADKKISELSALSGADAIADTDEVEIVDKSDTTFGASGTNKRVTIADLSLGVFERSLPEFETSTPSAPASGVRLFARRKSGRRLAAMIGPSGVDTALQPLLASNCVAFVRPNGNSTTLAQVGLALTATGTATAANVATTSLHASMRRIEYLVTTAATTAVAGFRGAANQFWRGNAPGLGGFFFVCRWAPATGQATATKRAFCGLKSSTSAPTDAEASAGLNILGMGKDSADSNWQFMTNDGAGTATKVDLGAAFAVPSTDRSKVYELSMFCAPNGSAIFWQVADLDTGAIATGSATSDIPANTTLLNPWAYCSVGGTSSVIGIALFSLYIETDN
jgi:hypothetical protein